MKKIEEVEDEIEEDKTGYYTPIDYNGHVRFMWICYTDEELIMRSQQEEHIMRLLREYDKYVMEKRKK